jgi:hypothetical protein
MARNNVAESWIPGRGLKSVFLHIFDTVVANKVVSDPAVSDTNGLLDKATLLEWVGINQGANKSSLGILEIVYIDLARGGREGGGGEVRGALPLSLGNAAIGGLLLWALESPFLLARGEGLVQLAVDEKVVEDAAGAPGDAVGPAFDS